MKAVCVIAVLSILLLECPRGYWNVFRLQAQCCWADIKDSLAVRVSIAFLAVFLLDSVLLASIQSIQHPIGVRLIQLGGSIGQNVNFWMLMVLVYGLTKAFKRKRWSRIWLGAMFSAAMTGAVCNLFKIIGLRSRPQAGEGPLSFFNIEGYSQHKGLVMSFSSGDVAIVAGAAFFLAHCVRDRRLKCLLLLAPLLTAASRIYLNRHWPSDTLLSLAFGLIVGHYLYRSYIAAYTDYSQLPLTVRLQGPKIFNLPVRENRSLTRT